jgi:hypothetical protein
MKKAQLVISTEYRLNTPSVFLQIEKDYYGCLIYPRSRNFPDADYWASATSSDDGRYFSTTQVTVDNDTLELITKLQNVCKANSSMIVRKSYPCITKNWQIRRGKVYEAWKLAHDAQQEEIKQEYLRNKPYEAAYNDAYSQLRKILLSFKNN